MFLDYQKIPLEYAILALSVTGLVTITLMYFCKRRRILKNDNFQKKVSKDRSFSKKVYVCMQNVLMSIKNSFGFNSVKPFGNDPIKKLLKKDLDNPYISDIVKLDMSMENGKNYDELMDAYRMEESGFSHKSHNIYINDNS